MIAFMALAITACSKDEEPTQGFGVVNPETAQGIKLTLTYPDSSDKNVSGDRVFGWNNGQLLNGNYYKHLRGGGEEVTFDFRLSIPEDVNSAAIIEDVHDLRSTRLKLEQTQSLEDVEVEFWLGSLDEEDEFDALVNVRGTVEIRIGWQGYDVMAEIDGEVVNRDGELVRVNGNFWKEKAD